MEKLKERLLGSLRYPSEMKATREKSSPAMGFCGVVERGIEEKGKDQETKKSNIP